MPAGNARIPGSQTRTHTRETRPHETHDRPGLIGPDRHSHSCPATFTLLTQCHGIETLSLANNGTFPTYQSEPIMIEVTSVNGRATVNIFDCGAANLTEDATARQRTSRGARASATCVLAHNDNPPHNVLSGTFAVIFDLLAMMLMSDADYATEITARETARQIGDSLLIEYLRAVVGVENCGLNADWCVSAFCLKGEHNETQNALYVIDEETNEPATWRFVRRWYADDSGRGHAAGLPFPQEAYEHADAWNNYAYDGGGNDYIGEEGPTYTAPAAFVEINRRLGIATRPARVRPTLGSPIGEWAEWLRGQGFPDACVDADSVRLIDAPTYRVHLTVNPSSAVGVSVWVNMDTPTRTVPMALTGGGCSGDSEIDCLLNLALALRP